MKNLSLNEIREAFLNYFKKEYYIYITNIWLHLMLEDDGLNVRICSCEVPSSMFRHYQKFIGPKKWHQLF